MNTIKGLLIDPENQTITEVNVNPDSYAGDDTSHLGSIYKHLQCSCVDVVRCLLEYLPNKPVDDVWIDDNGNYLRNVGRSASAYRTWTRDGART